MMGIKNQTIARAHFAKVWCFTTSVIVNQIPVAYIIGYIIKHGKIFSNLQNILSRT